MKFNYPSARRDESVSDDYHGTKVKDPYRWLEDPDSEETKAFVEAQNAVSNPFIEQCEYRQKIQESLTEKWNFAKYSSPAEHGGYYYYYHNSGLQNQSVMYVQDSLDGEPRVFLDPNKLSEDGTLAISGTAFSEDGSFFAYGLSQSGSDWITIKFKECPSGKDLPDTLEHVKFSSMAWTHDNKGMFYNRYPVDGKSDGTETTSNFYHRLYYHVLGTKQSEDVLAVEFSNEPKWKMEKPVANGNSTSTPSLTLSPSNNKANQMYETSYIVSSVAVAAAAGGSNFNPLYGASAPPAYSNYHTPNFYGLSYSPSKFRKPLNNEDSSSLPKETMLKPKQKEKAMKKQKKKNNQSKTTAPKNCSTPQPSCTNKQNLTNENFNQYGYNYSTPHYNQLPNQMYDSGSYGQLNPSYCQQYAGYMNGPTNSVYYPSYGTSLNQYYPAGSSYAASALTNLPEHTANSVCSVPYPSHPTTSVAESVTYTSRPTSPIVGSASYPYHPTTSVAESTLYPSPPTSPVAESVSYPTCPTSPVVGSSSCPYRPTSPVVGSASCPYRPTSPVVGLASYPYHSTTSVAGPTPYPYCQTSPVAESASYPSYPNYFTSYPYSPYWYQQNACSPYSYNSYYQQPQFAYKQNHPDVCPLKKSCGQEMTNEKSKMASHFKTGKFGSTPDTIFVANFRGAEVSDCGKYLLLSPNEGCDPVNRLFYVALDKLPNGITGKLPYTILVDNFDAQYEYITNEGSVFTFLTNLNAPKYKVINIDFTKPEQENWQTLIEEDENAVLEWVSCVNKNKLVLCYLKDVKNKIYIHSLETGKLLNEIPLDIGTVIGCSGKKKNKEIFIHFMSFLTPGVIYRVDLSVDDPKPEVYRLIKVSNFDFSQFEIKQIFYPSKDGTKIPMFLVHKKGLVLDGKNPTYLYGYGGFEISIKPTFSVSRLVFLKDLGGLFAVANIRGGGEYGETWHRSGTHSKKQNVFDDFQAAADYLISQKYTTSEKLVIHGHSNGGLLIAACINQRPELYGCAIAQVGVLDMLRFHRFTIGHAWTTDFGCSEVPEHFKFLKEYSPVHNIRVPKGDIQYPSTLLLTADHDDRVVPLHSLKYIAELQHTMKDQEKQTKPLMIKVDTKAGHGSGKPTAKMIQEHTDLYCFIMKTLHLTWHES